MNIKHMSHIEANIAISTFLPNRPNNSATIYVKFQTFLLNNTALKTAISYKKTNFVFSVRCKNSKIQDYQNQWQQYPN